MCWQHVFSRAAALAMACGILAWAAPSAAGPVETINGVAFDPNDPDFLAAIYYDGKGGLIVSEDGGSSWQLLCSSAVVGGEPHPRTEPKLAIMSDGNIVFGGEGLVARSSDKACGWSLIEQFTDKIIVGVTRDPSDPASAYVSVFEGTSLSIFQSTDDGQSWSMVGTPTEGYFDRVHVAEGDSGTIMYQSFGRLGLDGTTVEQFVRVSDDGGQNWTENAANIPYDELELLGIDPSNTDRVFALATDQMTSESFLMVNDTQGAGAWTEVRQIGLFGGLEVLPNGDAYVADATPPETSGPEARGAVWKIPAGGSSAELLTDAIGAQCVAYHPATQAMYVCGPLDLYTVSLQTGEITDTVLTLTEVASFVDCAGVDMPAVCEDQFTVDGYCHETHLPDAPVCDLLPGASTGTGGNSGSSTATGGSGGVSAGGSGGIGGSGATSGGVGGMGLGGSGGGSPMTGGSAATGGSPGTGGTGTGGTAGLAGTGGGGGSSGGCRVAGPASSSDLGGWLAIGLALAWVVRRRAR